MPHCNLYIKHVISTHDACLLFSYTNPLIYPTGFVLPLAVQERTLADDVIDNKFSQSGMQMQNTI